MQKVLFIVSNRLYSSQVLKKIDALCSIEVFVRFSNVMSFMLNSFPPGPITTAENHFWSVQSVDSSFIRFEKQSYLFNHDFK